MIKHVIILEVLFGHVIFYLAANEPILMEAAKAVDFRIQHAWQHVGWF